MGAGVEGARVDAHADGCGMAEVRFWGRGRTDVFGEELKGKVGRIILAEIGG